jgi:hypothetical protein
VQRFDERLEELEEGEHGDRSVVIGGWYSGGTND